MLIKWGHWIQLCKTYEKKIQNCYLKNQSLHKCFRVALIIKNETNEKMMLIVTIDVGLLNVIG